MELYPFQAKIYVDFLKSEIDYDKKFFEERES